MLQTCGLEVDAQTSRPQYMALDPMKTQSAVIRTLHAVSDGVMPVDKMVMIRTGLRNAADLIWDATDGRMIVVHYTYTDNMSPMNPHFMASDLQFVLHPDTTYPSQTTTAGSSSTTADGPPCANACWAGKHTLKEHLELGQPYGYVYVNMNDAAAATLNTGTLLTHELMHYLIGLGDEYVAHDFDQPEAVNAGPVQETGISHYAGCGGSLMDDHWNGWSEIDAADHATRRNGKNVASPWGSSTIVNDDPDAHETWYTCQYTDQWLWRGMSSWEWMQGEEWDGLAWSTPVYGITERPWISGDPNSGPHEHWSAQVTGI